MNTFKATLLATLCFSALLAQSQTPDEPKELQDLRSSFERARTAALSPLEKKYIDALTGMKDRLTKNGDLMGALAVDAEINRLKPPAALSELGVDAPVETAKSPLQSLMDGSRWEWFNSPEPVGEGRNWVEFYKNGEGHSGWAVPLRYTVTGLDTLKVTIGEADGTCFFVVDTAKKIARHDPTAGAGFPRSMVYEKRISSTNPNK